ncbi:short-subunit dehydrogenase [Bacillus ectoiniformans]|uniref:SDR family NAD(P)-dependent oxidoreductase n=1 Tax=Bacillus ectoiniformans TaxID=1494429 RepID=UPI001959062E|nr:SDR family oxidoreductase [Bacillus ectoiniformans]MBM7650251.1 short-subunit dehydrogenase [Bacillus ectoiniformans]
MKACLITGAGTGLGKELACLYAEKGYMIYLVGRSENKLAEVQSVIQDNGGKAKLFVCDLKKTSDIEALASYIKAENIILDLVVNNAGIGIFGAFQEASAADLETTFQTNVYGPILLTKSLLPVMNSGTFINIISTAGLRGKANEAIYCASKFALRGFTEALQKEYENSEFRFIAAYMGGMNTPFWDDSNYVKNPSHLPSPKTIAEQIVEEAKTSDEIIIERN